MVHFCFPVTAIALIGEPDEIPLAFTLPYMMCSSDAGVAEMFGNNAKNAHPQDAGTFPAFLRELVTVRKQLTLPDAVRRITYLPAERMGLDAKGRLSVGADADLVVFDPAAIESRARFPHEGDPCAEPAGIKNVIVNGEIAVLDNRPVNTAAGKLIKQNGGI